MITAYFYLTKRFRLLMLENRFLMISVLIGRFAFMEIQPVPTRKCGKFRGAKNIVIRYKVSLKYSLNTNKKTNKF